MQEAWFTFDPQLETSTDPKGFSFLEVLKEGRFPPCATEWRRTHQAAEVITYVREGTLGYEDATGLSGLIRAGEFQRMTVERGIRHNETNASPTEWAHVFQIWLGPSKMSLKPGHEQKRFSVAMRRGALCLVASPDARKGSLRIHQDACLYSAILDRGQHIIHYLLDGRNAWLHLVDGAVALGDTVLRTGDGLGVSGERVVSFTAKGETELLLLDLGPSLPTPSENKEIL